MNSETRKAIGLLSGGLDSMIALRLVLDQNLPVKVISFWTPFFARDIHKTRISQTVEVEPVKHPRVLQYASELGCDVECVDLSEDYLNMLHHPRSGYGKNVNPCVDCHTMMFDTARRMMEREGYDFVFTGEVLGQRPKSQQMQELKLIARRAGLEGLILRPMSAQLMEPTIPEENGWIDRSRLLSLQGRSRKPQMALAEKYEIGEYPTPAGGCVLTEPAYGNKVKDMWMYNDRDKLTWEDYNLLRVGRHLRVNPELKVVVARDEDECRILDGYQGGRTRIEPTEVPGPVVLIDGAVDDEKETIAARICARYVGKGRFVDSLAVEIMDESKSKIVNIEPFKHGEVEAWVIL